MHDGSVGDADRDGNKGPASGNYRFKPVAALVLGLVLGVIAGDTVAVLRQPVVSRTVADVATGVNECKTDLPTLAAAARHEPPDYVSINTLMNCDTQLSNEAGALREASKLQAEGTPTADTISAAEVASQWGETALAIQILHHGIANARYSASDELAIAEYCNAQALYYLANSALQTVPVAYRSYEWYEASAKASTGVGRAGAAESQFARAIYMAPSALKANVLREEGAAMLSLGLIDKAIMADRAWLADASASTRWTAMKALSEVYAASGDYQKAIEWTKSALSGIAKDAAARTELQLSMTQLLLDAGQLGAARQELAQIRLGPNAAASDASEYEVLRNALVAR